MMMMTFHERTSTTAGLPLYKMVQLNKDFFSQLRPSKHFIPETVPTESSSSSSSQCTSLDFDGTGEFLVVASELGDSIQVFGCGGGERKRIIYSKKYGVGQIKFAHSPSTVIYSSTKGDDDAIRYLSLHDNKYLRYFRGHTKRVQQLLLNPLNDTFISVAPEEALCLWDLRTTHMQGRLNFSPSSEGLAAFDPQGLVFAVATASKFIRLYDSRNWERGAFATFELTAASEASSSSIGPWKNLLFSPDGKEILLQTSSASSAQSAIILDSFDGSFKGTLECSGNNNTCLQYTPDSKFIIGGRTDGRLDVWNSKDFTSSLPILAGIEGFSPKPIKELAFNPKFAMLATVGGDGTVFYI